MSLTLSSFSFIGKLKQFVTVHSKLSLLALLALACLTLSTQYFSSWHKGSWFINFQKDSESLVIGKIIHDQYDIKEKEIGNLYSITFKSMDYNIDRVTNINHIYKIFSRQYDSAKQISSFTPYISNFGLQGVLFSFLYNDLGIKFSFLQLMSAIFTAFCLATLSYQFSKIFSVGFGFCFFVVCFLSPWISNFARNLYWVPFTWFLPAVICNFLFLIRDTLKNKLIVYSLFTVAITIKSLCGYEYLSSVILFAIAPFIFLLITTNKKTKYFKVVFLLCVFSALGFVVVVLIHTFQRSDNLADGLVYLVKNDIERRCYGVGDQFNDNPAIKRSLEASVFEVLKIYLTDWNSKILYIVSVVGKKFWLLCFISVLLIFTEYNFFSKKNAKFYCALCFVFVLSPLSWIVLAKAHSFIHVHMNFVLWYFGFVQSLYFAILGFITSRLSEIFKRLN